MVQKEKHENEEDEEEEEEEEEIDEDLIAELCARLERVQRYVRCQKELVTSNKVIVVTRMNYRRNIGKLK